MKALTATDLTLILNGVLFAALLAAVVLLIGRIRRQRGKLNQPTISAQIAFPFPQRQTSSVSHTLPSEPLEQQDQQVREAYQAWIADYLLPDAEAGRAFLRIGVDKNWLRYQVTTTSFGQALAMLLCVLMAGEDPQAQSRFDRLLAFCLSHSSANAPDLMSWQVMPDVVPGRRLDADLNAEIWLAFALLAAQAQWGSSLRFNYGALARLRLAALLPLYQQAARSASETVIYAPYFYGLFASVAGEPAWNTFTSLLGNHARLKQTADFLPFTAEGSAVEAKRALSMLQAGVAVCWQAGFPQGKLPDSAEALARDTTARFAKADLLDETELKNEPAGLSPLGLLACCAPAVQSLQDQALLDQLWQGLSQAQPGRHDALGATLRLLALLQLSENIWFERAPWKALPALPED